MALARTAEDAALMLDAIAGFSRISPISVAPPWASAREIVAAAEDAKGLRVAYVSDIAGIGVEPEIDAICRATAMSLRDAGAVVEEIAFDVSDGKSPYQACVGSGWSGSNSPISTISRSSASISRATSRPASR